MALENLTRDAFAENLSTKFRLPFESGESREIELIEVSGLLLSGASEHFSIVFRGAPDFLLPQGTYRLEHERLGSFDLFLVAVARVGDGFHYEAVFNRFVKGAEKG